MHWTNVLPVFYIVFFSIIRMTPHKTKNDYPYQVIYNSPYAHYQWEGKLYVDPITGKGAFYDPDYGFWSRPGVTKIPTDIPLNYSKEQNPLATSHWEVPAYNAFKDTVARAVTNYLKRK